MGSVFVVEPMSFKVIDFLNAYATAHGNLFKVVNPETGVDIKGEVLNLKSVGISFFKMKHENQIGFVKSPESAGKTYVIEAELFVDFLPASSVSGVSGPAWEMLIPDADEMEKFFPIAQAVGEEFKVTVVLNPYSKDDDSAHLEPVPADPNFPNGALVCRILPKNKESKEEK